MTNSEKRLAAKVKHWQWRGWHDWFAWRPVRVAQGYWLWLRVVERYGGFRHNPFTDKSTLEFTYLDKRAVA